MLWTGGREREKGGREKNREVRGEEKAGREIQEMPVLCLLDGLLPHQTLTWGK